MLGQIRIPLGKRQYFTISGGPFMECPKTMKGVKMAKEIKQACAVDIPTEDFRTPDRKLLYKGLNAALDMVLAQEPLYVGCMGGKGRTGLFLAVLVKAFGVKQPVEFVRANYYAHAVETADQYAFVKKFKITPTMRKKVKTARQGAWLRYGLPFWPFNVVSLTRMPGPTEVVLGSSADQANLRASQRAMRALK